MKFDKAHSCHSVYINFNKAIAEDQS